jgi:putative ABC transport system ATP-binding protein
MTIFMTMIKATNLSQTYQSGGRPLTVLKDINLEIQPQGFVAIVGPSGSGKTTLLGLLAGLDNATSGSVELDGKNISTLTEDQRARFRAEKVGFVFQSFQLIPTLTAWENVVVPLELLGRENGKDYGARVDDLLDRVGLADRAHHYPTQLSGGEQQRVALARAFANKPRILFADEPTGNLDTKTGQKIIDLILELNRDAQTTLVLVTHDLELAKLAHTVIRLSGGEIVEQTTTDQS